ncbi:MAG: hypothetical protein ACFFF4_03965, partial [Candidatus Thorarchaeota archaeon]
YFEIGSTGVYEFHINTTKADSTGVFTFNIAFMWESGVSPLYENKTLQVNLNILERPTNIDYNPASATSYGEDAIYTFSYVDFLSTELIQNSPSLSILLNESSLTYSISYNPTMRIFTLTINTSEFGSTGLKTLHLNITWTGSPFYSAILLHSLTIDVIERASQLELGDYTPGQYMDVVTLQFTYTDLIADSSVGLSGTLTLNVGSGNYSVVFLGNGLFSVELNTTVFGATGSFLITATVAYSGSYYVSDAIHEFSFTVLSRSTQLTYSSPERTPFGDNVTFSVSYTDDATGTGIPSATVSLSCGTADEVLVLNTNYWINYDGNGVYTILINSSALGNPDFYSISVQLTRSGSPFYHQALRSVNAEVTKRPTELVILKTPGATPFLENITIQFRYLDRGTGLLITLDKTMIELSHGSGPTLIPSNSYTLYNYGTYYEISFNSTVLDNLNLVSSHQVYILLNRSSTNPYFAERTTSLVASTVERQTQLLFPLISPTPYYDNISLYLDYLDFSTSNGIIGALVTITTSNASSPTYYVEELGNGQYLIEIPTTQFGTTGLIFINISVSRTGIPFYSTRTATQIPATIRLVQTSLIAEISPAGSVVAGVNMVINLTLSDSDHDLPVTGAIFATSWTNTTTLFAEIGSGIYSLTLNTTGLTAQKYTFSISSSKALYATANISVTILLGAATTQITVEQSIYYADWGEHILVRAVVRETNYFAPIDGMNVTILWDTRTYDMTDLGNGTYALLLDSSDSDYGNYEPIITASRQYYQTKQRAFSLIVSKAPGQIVPESALITIYYDSEVNFYIYLNDTISNAPVSSASLTMEWNNTVYVLTSNGTLGFFDGNISSVGFEIGVYTLTFSAFAPNHNFLDLAISVSINPIATQLELEGNPTSIVVYYGDIIQLRVHYNDSLNGGAITGALVEYVLGSLSGNLTEDLDGTYFVTLNTSLLAAQSLYLRLYASKENYATNIRLIVTNILLRPTSVTVIEAVQSGHFLETVGYSFNLNDTLSNMGIENATITIIWDGPDGTISETGNGGYGITLLLDLTQPRDYLVIVTFTKSNYESISINVWATLQPTFAEIIAPSLFYAPINEPSSISIQLVSLLDNSTISDIEGIADWSLFGTTSLEMLPNGNYSLLIRGDLPLGTYSVLLSFLSSRYAITSRSLDIIVRPIATSLTTTNTTLDSFPGDLLTLTLTFWDTDHDAGVTGANIDVSFTEGAVEYLGFDEEDGVYHLGMTVNAGQTFYVTVTFSKENYSSQVVVYEIHSDITSEQLLTQALTLGGGSALILASLLIVLYLRVWSIPKIIRAINRMLKQLNKGKIPVRADVALRSTLLLAMINEELKPSGVVKDRDDIVGESIEISVPEVEELLEYLANLTGLGQIEIDAFRADLARMKSSERPGFLKEVIAQEEARRADDIARADMIEEPEVEEVTLEQTPEDLEEIREKLLTKGMSPDEIDIILDEAKNLSKADLKALLDSLGIKLE